MDNIFTVVTDVSEIAKLNKQLASHLGKTFRFKEVREITYPAGHFTGSVFFKENKGEDVQAWSPRIDGDKLINFFLVGEPGVSKWIEITVQFNLPRHTYNRRLAGAFVKDINGDVFLAHRGKLTKGRAALSKASVFREFSSRLVEADDDGQPTTLILIAALDDAELADRLFEFAAEAREVATRLGGDAEPSSAKKSENTGTTTVDDPKKRNGKTSTVNSKPLLRLRSYFDEYAGEGQTKGHGGGKRTVEHGDIVKALEVMLRKSGETQKSQAIDLAVVSPTSVDLFEVKTSSRTTDVYTGVGQLLIHGGCIADLLTLPVRRHLVLPNRPNKLHEPHIVKKGGMNIVTFQKIDGSYKFTGI
ncbi:hypothetical protein [Noviherbaspirillum sp.]|uniref:hypothetical protein n=1 Tax=Noviherbaspirillum sp. TaxID=1926288 RepID=UPI002FE3754C